MNILDVMSTCESAALSVFLPIVKNILLLIQIIVPITLLVMCVIEFSRLSINPDDKKGIKKIINKFLAAFFVFIIPVLINVVMSIVGETTEFSNCWNNANSDIIINDNNPTDNNDTTSNNPTDIDDSDDTTRIRIGR